MERPEVTVGRNQHTPWGPPHYGYSYGEGITFFGTGGHGGYLLGDERMAAFRARFPDFRSFAGGPWFEEDCDAAIIKLAFPDRYEAGEIFAAVRSARQSAKWEAESIEKPNPRRIGYTPQGWIGVVAWLDSAAPEAVELRRIADAFNSDNADKWERGGMSSSPKGYAPGCCDVRLYRLGDKKLLNVVFADYPPHGLLTDEDIERLRAVPIEPAIAAWRHPIEICDGPSDADPGL